MLLAAVHLVHHLSAAVVAVVVAGAMWGVAGTEAQPARGPASQGPCARGGRRLARSTRWCRLPAARGPPGGPIRPTCQKHSSRARPSGPSPCSVATRKWRRSCTPSCCPPAAWPQPLAAQATACRSAAVMHHLRGRQRHAAGTAARQLASRWGVLSQAPWPPAQQKHCCAVHWLVQAACQASCQLANARHHRKGLPGSSGGTTSIYPSHLRSSSGATTP